MIVKKSSEGTTTQKRDYRKTLLLSLEDLQKYAGHALQTVTIPPHTKQRKHLHHEQTEVAYVLSGEAIYVVNGIEHTAQAGDVIVDEPEEEHYIINNTDTDFVILVFKINMPSNSDDTTWLEE